jgi:cyclic pyranopterin phosphate synthase
LIDITSKRVSLRRAVAEGRVAVRPETVEAIRQGEIPKGSVAEVTKAAALLGLKRTPELLPFCHPIPIEHGAVEVDLEERAVRVRVEVAAIARTGVEVEAMTGAAIAALNVYDMVKPLDSSAHISGVRLIEKRGGKSDGKETFDRELRGAVLVVSDSVAAGSKHDTAGRAVSEALAEHDIRVAETDVLPDEPNLVAERVAAWCDDGGLDLVFAVGGTGLGPRDKTPETVRPLLEREIPGIAEAIRAHGRERTPLADLSRTVAGQRGTTVVVALAGSTRGAREAMDALLPWLLHVVKVFDKTYRHGR